MTPLGHYTHEAVLVSDFRASLHDPLQQHSGTAFACSLEDTSFPPSPLEMKINMTVPVTCLIKSGCTDFKISFFVPFEHQDSPPQPTDLDVFIEEWKAAAIFVR